VSARELHLEDDALALVALGVLPAAESREVEEHLAACADCRRRLAYSLGDVALLAESVAPEAPPPRAREALLERLAADAPPAPRERRAAVDGMHADAPRPAAAAAPPARRRRAARLLPLAASFLLGATVGALAVRQALVDDVERLRARAEAAAAERADAALQAERLSHELATARAALALTPSPEAVPLAGLPAAPEARGRVFVDRAGGRALFVARGLPALPEGRTYQLWRIVGGEPRPAGLLDAAEGTVVVEGVDATAGEVWAVTEERAGGVDSPSGPMVLSS
jgi:anti-sigma-K factor RskA